MLLQLQAAGVPMKRVYDLARDLEANPGRVAAAQALTLNAAKPLMGLKGTHGLFGSEAWWESIRQRRMPLEFVAGIVQRAYVAGQGDSGPNNTVDLLLDDGSTRSVGIYTNDRRDAALFRPGCRVELVYALDELKRQPAPDGSLNCSKVALEMAVSLEPVRA
jgi:hypothetical protein